MPDTDPVFVYLNADPSDLVNGVVQAKQAMQDLGDETEKTGTKFIGASQQSKGMFRAMVEMRVALMSSEHVMKSLGLQTEATKKVFEAMNLVMDIGITIMAIYRAAQAAKAL